jgi:hypothetical protein
MRKDILRVDRQDDEFSMVDLKEAILEIYEAGRTDPKLDIDETLRSLSAGERIVTPKAIYRIFRPRNPTHN